MKSYCIWTILSYKIVHFLKQKQNNELFGTEFNEDIWPLDVVRFGFVWQNFKVSPFLRCALRDAQREWIMCLWSWTHERSNKYYETAKVLSVSSYIHTNRKYVSRLFTIFCWVSSFKIASSRNCGDRAAFGIVYSMNKEKRE